MAELLCPKCKAPMESIERSGVTIEHCTECHGLFLDRGELERIFEAEAPGLGPEAPAGRPSTGIGSQSSGDLIHQVLDMARQYRGGGRRGF